jgi:hypothetical protein
VIIAVFLLWTGELILTAITLGWHRPKWKGYEGFSPLKRVTAEISISVLGFVFWMVSIPAIVKIIETYYKV